MGGDIAQADGGFEMKRWPAAAPCRALASANDGLVGVSIYGRMKSGYSLG